MLARWERQQQAVAAASGISKHEMKKKEPGGCFFCFGSKRLEKHWCSSENLAKSFRSRVRGAELDGKAETKLQIFLLPCAYE
jgi:hypothetical protein